PGSCGRWWRRASRNRRCRRRPPRRRAAWPASRRGRRVRPWSDSSGGGTDGGVHAFEGPPGGQRGAAQGFGQRGKVDELELGRLQRVVQGGERSGIALDAHASGEEGRVG